MITLIPLESLKDPNKSQTPEKHYSEMDENALKIHNDKLYFIAKTFTVIFFLFICICYLFNLPFWGLFFKCFRYFKFGNTNDFLKKCN